MPDAATLTQIDWWFMKRLHPRAEACARVEKKLLRVNVLRVTPPASCGHDPSDGSPNYTQDGSTASEVSREEAFIRVPSLTVRISIAHNADE